MNRSPEGLPQWYWHGLVEVAALPRASAGYTIHLGARVANSSGARGHPQEHASCLRAEFTVVGITQFSPPFLEGHPVNTKFYGEPHGQQWHSLYARCQALCKLPSANTFAVGDLYAGGLWVTRPNILVKGHDD